MYNDNTELLKLVYLSQFDVDKEHSTVHINVSTNEITIHLFINPGFRNCPCCKSAGALIHDRKIKRIYHPIIENKKNSHYFPPN